MKEQELKEYVAEHGNSLVPHIYTQNKSLGKWVHTQRKYFKASQRGDAVMPVQKLNDIGFVWDASKAQWLERIQELKEYKQNFGDTLVPAVYDTNPSIGIWVSHQRRCNTYYEKMTELEEKWRDVEVLDDEVKEQVDQLNLLAGDMNNTRIELLEAEGFIWDVRAYLWELQFQKLQSFIDLNGHAPIMSKKIYDPSAFWVNTQRKNYRKNLKGQHTSLTEERIKQLNSIRFDWKVAQRSPKCFEKLLLRSFATHL